jgi:hypothetical protein
MKITDIPINHPTFEAAWDAVASCHDSLRKRGRAERLSILGVSGVGKSTLLKRYRERHPHVKKDGCTHVPVAYISIPARPNFNQFCTALLVALDAPLAQEGTAYAKLSRFVKLAEKCAVELLLVDEMQHFVDRGSTRTYGAVADELKMLCEKLEKPVVLAGAPRMQILFETNMQLRRRFKSSIHLTPFDFQHEFEEFRGFLNTLVIDMMLPHAERFTDPMLAEKIWYATDGIPGNIVDFIDKFDQRLHGKPASKWTNYDLAEAFRAAIWCDAPDHLNPFMARGEAKLRRLNHFGEPYSPSILDGDNHALPRSVFEPTNKKKDQ